MSTVYATELDYLKLNAALPDNFPQLAEKASRAIDTLTFNRIVDTGFDSLTEFQQQTITECCCDIVKFYDDNADMLDMVFNSYSINGVSMQLDFNAALYKRSGVLIRSSTYNRLMTTGLCCGVI